MGAEDDTLAGLAADWARLWTRTAQAQARTASEALSGEGPEADALWRAAEAQAEAWRQAAAAVGAMGAASAPGAATLARFLDPGQWLFGGVGAPDPATRRFIIAPAGGDFGRAALAGSPQARALAGALSRHRALVARAFARMAARAAREAADGPLTLEAAQARWVAAAEALDALHASDAFLTSQAEVLRAAVALRAAEAAAVEAFCAERGLPTRAEVDDLHRTVAELRRELRALKRALGRA